VTAGIFQTIQQKLAMKKMGFAFRTRESAPDTIPMRAWPAFHPGATALISLGCAVLAIGIATSLTSTDRNNVVSRPGTHRSPGSEAAKEDNKTEMQQFHIDQAQYLKSQQDVVPSPQTAVFKSGPNFAQYHWHKNCPMLHGLKRPHKLKFIMYMARQQAQANGDQPCHYCC
jgi:hypothetical protein